MFWKITKKFLWPRCVSQTPACYVHGQPYFSVCGKKFEHFLNACLTLTKHTHHALNLPQSKFTNSAEPRWGP